MAAPKRLTPDAFQRAAARLPGVAAPRLEAARLILVEGRSIRDVASQFRWRSTNTAWVCAKLVWAEAQRDQHPIGWIELHLVAPPELARSFEKQLAAYRARRSNA